MNYHQKPPAVKAAEDLARYGERWKLRHDGESAFVTLKNSQLVVCVADGAKALASFDKLAADCELSTQRYPRAFKDGGGFNVYMTKPRDLDLYESLGAYPGITFMSGGDEVPAAGSAGWRWDDYYQDLSMVRPEHIACPAPLLKLITDDSDGTAPEEWKPSKKVPYAAAQKFQEQKHPTLVRFNSDWLEWNGSHYATIEDDTIKAELYAFLSTGYKPNKSDVAHVEDALQAVAHKPTGTFAPPCWIGPAPTSMADGVKTTYHAKDVLAFKDSLLHLPTMTVLKPTPDFFTLNALSYSFDPNAAKPKLWRKFLLDVFKGSRKSIGVLQEIFGHMLLSDSTFQKSFLWVSPPRGGKGTTLNILQKMVGAHNCVSPTMAGIGKDHILHSMVGKQVAIVSDMQINRNTNISDVVGNILRITGNDSVTFDRKFKDAWTGRLSVRFFILTNLPPSFPDISGAITNRFIILQSFMTALGNEDVGLEAKLTAELPGILLWAMEGWKRLKARGHFVQPPQGERVLRTMAETSLPVRGFVREACILDPAAVTPKAEIYRAWVRWEDNIGDDVEFWREGERDDGAFGRAMLSAYGDKVRETRPRIDGERVQSWSGIRLRDWLYDGLYDDPM